MTEFCFKCGQDRNFSKNGQTQLVTVRVAQKSEEQYDCDTCGNAYLWRRVMIPP
jgi:hypothetical protein